MKTETTRSLGQFNRCGRCRAYEPRGVGVKGGRGIEYSCTLGYHEENGVPQEMCSKPMTISKMLAEKAKAM